MGARRFARTSICIRERCSEQASDDASVRSSFLCPAFSLQLSCTDTQRVADHSCCCFFVQRDEQRQRRLRFVWVITNAKRSRQRVPNTANTVLLIDLASFDLLRFVRRRNRIR